MVVFLQKGEDDEESWRNVHDRVRYVRVTTKRVTLTRLTQRKKPVSRSGVQVEGQKPSSLSYTQPNEML